MLEWTTAGPGPRLGLLVHHDDAEREVAYDRASAIGRLARGLDEAAAARVGGRQHEARLEVRVPVRGAEISGVPLLSHRPFRSASIRTRTQPPPTFRGVLMRWKPCASVADRFQGW